MYHASITNSDKWSIIVSCQSNSSLTAFIAEDFATVPTMMLEKGINSSQYIITWLFR
jgi:hypothetical protein